MLINMAWTGKSLSLYIPEKDFFEERLLLINQFGLMNGCPKSHEMAVWDILCF